MTLESALVALLLQDSAVSLLVVDRIDPVQSPQRKSPTNAITDPGSFPRIVYKRISISDRIISQDGPGPQAKSRVQCDCYGLTAKSANDTCEAILHATQDGQRLHGWKQTDMNGVFVEKVELENDHWAGESPQEGGATGVFVASIDAACVFYEQ